MSFLKTEVKFTSHKKEFIARSAMAHEMTLAHMAQDIEIGIKTSGRTPFKKGPLRDQTRHKRINALQYEVRSNVEYAAAQELGRAGGRTFRRYTTPGTGPGWFRAAVEGVSRNSKTYFSQAMKAVGL